MSEKVTKRFIAGAVCPRCAEMDKLVMYTQDDRTFRECVKCDFKDEMLFQNNPRELETRVNVTEDMKKAETQVLTLDPKGSNSKN